MPHTPGPWTIHGWGEDNYEVNADDETVCNVPGFDDETVDSDRAEANARLIAAAPELLAALKELREFVADNLFFGPEATRADQAIAKAEGRSE